jgi:hypothetical protein
MQNKECIVQNEELLEFENVSLESDHSKIVKNPLYDQNEEIIHNGDDRLFTMRRQELIISLQQLAQGGNKKTRMESLKDFATATKFFLVNCFCFIAAIPLAIIFALLCTIKLLIANVLGYDNILIPEVQDDIKTSNISYKEMLVEIFKMFFQEFENVQSKIVSEEGVTENIENVKNSWSILAGSMVKQKAKEDQIAGYPENLEILDF